MKSITDVLEKLEALELEKSLCQRAGDLTYAKRMKFAHWKEALMWILEESDDQITG